MNNNLNFNWLIKHPISFIAFGFGIGLMKAAGTFGSILGIIIFLILKINFELSLQTILIITIIFLIIGIFICDYSEFELKIKDYGGIVWDEISAMMLVLCFIPLNYLYWILAFILFRMFDILKPWPIKYLDKNISGGFGIMLDDIIASFFSICIIKIIIFLNIWKI